MLENDLQPAQQDYLAYSFMLIKRTQRLTHREGTLEFILENSVTFGKYFRFPNIPLYLEIYLYGAYIVLLLVYIILLIVLLLLIDL